MTRRLIFALFCFAGVALCCPGASVQAAHSKGLELRVMTYNIHVGIGMDKRLDLKRIAEVIKRERADLVGLQEVDRGVERTGRVDEIAELARLTDMGYAFADNLRYQGGWYGVAVLSRFPIERIEHWRYANRREAERRGLLRVVVFARGRRLSFVTTHLDYQREDGRVFEAEQLLRSLADVNEPLIVSGDFNEEPDGDAYRLMRARFADAWTDNAAAGDGRTYPADIPTKRIDYVFYRSGDGGRLRVTSARVVPTQASDHRPLLVSFNFESVPAVTSGGRIGGRVGPAEPFDSGAFSGAIFIAQPGNSSRSPCGSVALRPRISANREKAAARQVEWRSPASKRVPRRGSCSNREVFGNTAVGCEKGI